MVARTKPPASGSQARGRRDTADVGKQSRDELDQAERIWSAIHAAGGYDAVAATSGIPRSSLTKYATGVSECRASVIGRIAKATGKSVSWLVTGEEADAAGDPEFAQVTALDVRASAGNGSFVVSELARPPLAFRRDWLARVVRNPARCHVITVDGDSMHPTLSDGDVILVERLPDDARRPSREGLYVLRDDDLLLVKRMIKVAGTIWKICSDNLSYSQGDREIDFSNPPDDIEVLGRVRWVGRRI